MTSPSSLPSTWITPKGSSCQGLGLPISNLILLLKSTRSSNRLSGLDIVVPTAVGGATHFASLPVWQEKQGRWPHLTHRKWEGEASPGGYAGGHGGMCSGKGQSCPRCPATDHAQHWEVPHAFCLCCLFHRRKQSWSDPQTPCPEKLLIGNLPGQMLPPARRELRFFSR